MSQFHHDPSAPPKSHNRNRVPNDHSFTLFNDTCRLSFSCSSKIPKFWWLQCAKMSTVRITGSLILVDSIKISSRWANDRRLIRSVKVVVIFRRNMHEIELTRVILLVCLVISSQLFQDKELTRQRFYGRFTTRDEIIHGLRSNILMNRCRRLFSLRLSLLFSWLLVVHAKYRNTTGYVSYVYKQEFDADSTMANIRLGHVGGSSCCSS